MSLRLTSWILYIVGIALVAGGYLGFVSAEVSWIGWIIGMAGWAMQFLPGYRQQPANEETKIDDPGSKQQ